MKQFSMAILLLMSLGAAPVAAVRLPDAIAAPGDVLLTVHAEGAQIYECAADGAGKTTWRFREPIASLFSAGKTLGRHYAGPTWEIGGGAIVGKVSGHAPGVHANDVAWLRLDIASRHGAGPLTEATLVQRINTAGGNLTGSCRKAGDLHAEPYSADYLFIKRR